MKVRVLFWFVLIFTVAAFTWWTYSLVTLKSDQFDQKIIYLEREAELKTMEMALTLKGDEFQKWAIGKTEAEKTSKIKEEYEKKYSEFKWVEVNGNFKLEPRLESIQKIKEDKSRKTLMYIYEGIAFLSLILLAFIWVYRALNRIIFFNQQQNNFLLSVTHELKTPIASIKLFLQTLQRKPFEFEKVRELAGNAIEDTDRLNELVENVLWATRMESKNYDFHNEQVDLSELVEQIFFEYAKKYNGVYSWQDSIEGDIKVLGDAFSLKLALRNIIDNAIKYSPQGSMIEVSLNINELGHVQVKVADQGVGIKDEEKELVFKKFFRSGNEMNRSTKGTGLGLYLVKEIVLNHDGNVEVLNNKPQGTIFKINLLPS